MAAEKHCRPSEPVSRVRNAAHPNRGWPYRRNCRGLTCLDSEQRETAGTVVIFVVEVVVVVVVVVVVEQLEDEMEKQKQ